MAQDPLLIDQVQIEPGSGDTLLIKRSTDGSLDFRDALIPGGITLRALAGLNLAGVSVVSPLGAGADHSTIQAALDCIPATSGPTEPYAILIGPGVYQETINIVRDGVFLIGIGGAVLDPLESAPNGPGAYHTVVVQEGLGTVPEHVVFRNLTIRNPHDNYACVRVVGGAGSSVGATGISIEDCILQATAAGGNRPLWATSMNHLTVQGGSFGGSSQVSQALVTECAGFSMSGVLGVTGLQMDYDNMGTLPSTTGSLYTLSSCPHVGVGSTLNPPIRSTLNGGGTFQILNCGEASDVTVGGDRTFTVVGTNLSGLTINDTSSGTLLGSSADTITAAVTATLDRLIQQGVLTFTASTSQAVVFPVAFSDSSYQVFLELSGAPLNADTPWVTGKTASGFTVNFSFAQTMALGWSALRVI